MTELHQVACRGKNCGRTDETHSFECLEEHSLCAGYADFSAALRALKEGHKVARRGWNGKGMWLNLVPAELADKVAFQYAALGASPWIGMKTADDKFVPWLASQTDVLAEDWVIVG